MDVELGYLPKRYYDENPDAEGYFPFALAGTTTYVFAIDGFYLPECDENFLPLWMQNIKAFPLYVCAEIPSYLKEDFEYTCKEFTISYRYLSDNQKLSISVTEIKNEIQFRGIFPIYITIGSGNDLVLWSTNQDVFRVEHRECKGIWKGKIAETIVVNVEADTSIFWIGHDGDNITAISNNLHFSTYE